MSYCESLTLIVIVLLVCVVECFKKSFFLMGSIFLHLRLWKIANRFVWHNLSTPPLSLAKISVPPIKAVTLWDDALIIKLILCISVINALLTGKYANFGTRGSRLSIVLPMYAVTHNYY